MENNVIEGNWHKGIMMTGEFNSLEGGFPSNVRILNNRISGVRNEAIYAAFINPYGDPAPVGLYRNITIAGNTLRGTTADLELTSIDGLTLQNNHFPEGRESIITMHNCANVTAMDEPGSPATSGVPPH